MKRQVKPKPANTKLVQEQICSYCGRSSCTYQPVMGTFAVAPDGKRTLIKTEKIPGWGW